ncbi:MAG TPA: Holliday junction branch migration protein RuvA [Methylomirabilota bacterium]|nr:Holliday junction branch migration protein RuvA [Methylomirabilota bacterium]
MITFLQGTLAEKLPTVAVIDVQGIGYEALIPLSSYDKLPPVGQSVRLLTHLAIREDAHVLYGFNSVEERDLFRLLINNVSGIGPKTALNVLTGMSVNAFRIAVLAGDVKALAQISGVGKKTAERIVVELKDKFGKEPTMMVSGGAAPALGADDQKLKDAVQALVALEYKPSDAYEMVRGAMQKLGPNAQVEELLRASLKKGA